MASSTGDLNGSGPFYVQLDIWVGAQDIGGNQSRFDWVLYIGCSSNGWGTWAGNAQFWSTNIAGVGYSGTFTLDFRPSGSSGRAYAIASGSTWVGHNADGSRPGFPNYGSIDTDHSSVGDGTATTWVDAPTIPRATQPSIAEGTNLQAGQTVTINLPRASGGFTHNVNLDVAPGAYPYATVGTGIGTSVTYTIPMGTLNQIPNATSTPARFYVETWNGGTFIGSKIVDFTLSAPSSVIPDFTTVTQSEAVSAVSTIVGARVQNLSKLALAITGAAGVYGSTISSYKIEVAGQTINAQSGTTPAVISASGTVPIVATVTDSRGRSRSKTVNVTVLPYTPPVITTVDVVRATSGGTPNPDGTYLKLTMNAAVQSLVNGTEKNLLTYEVSTRPMGTTTWVTKGTWTSGIAYNSSRTIGTGGEYSIGSSYEIRITVTDRFNSIVAIRSTATTAVPFDVALLGTGHGKVWERGAIDIGGDAYVSGKVDVTGNLIVGGSFTLGGTLLDLRPMRGTTAERNTRFGTPATDAARVALANQQIRWFNTELGWEESYYAVTGLSGLTVDGLLAGTASGWYPTGKGPKLAMYPGASATAIPGVMGLWDTGSVHRRGSTAFIEQISNGTVQVKIAGRYRVRWQAAIQFGGGSFDMWFYAGSGFGNDAWELNPNYFKTHSFEYADVALAADDTCYAYVVAGTASVYVSSSSRRGEFIVEYLAPALVSD